MSMPFPCCCEPGCEECTELFGYNHYASLCGVTAATQAELTAPQQAENDAIAAWINANFNDVSLPLGGLTYNYSWAPYGQFPSAHFARIYTRAVAAGAGLPANLWKDFGFGVVSVYPCFLYNAWLTLGAHWDISGRACDPGYYWWLALDFRETLFPPASGEYSFCMYGGANYTGKDAFPISVGSPYYPPPRSCVPNVITDCAIPPSPLNAGGVFSEMDLTSSGGSAIPVDNPFVSGAEFVLSVGPLVSAAPPCSL